MYVTQERVTLGWPNPQVWRMFQNKRSLPWRETLGRGGTVSMQHDLTKEKMFQVVSFSKYRQNQPQLGQQPPFGFSLLCIISSLNHHCGKQSETQRVEEHKHKKHNHHWNFDHLTKEKMFSPPFGFSLQCTISFFNNHSVASWWQGWSSLANRKWKTW